jgi:transcriptional repressor NrdR
MLCPYCSHDDSKVIDKRDFGGITKRRRECLKCQNRFNTQEAVEQTELRVIKKDGRRENFDKEKIRRGLMRACEKRPVSTEKIEKMINSIQEKARKKGNDIKTTFIGELVSKELKKVDKVAYIRFASVYREFADVSDFKKEIKELVRG